MTLSETYCKNKKIIFQNKLFNRSDSKTINLDELFHNMLKFEVISMFIKRFSDYVMIFSLINVISGKKVN